MLNSKINNEIYEVGSSGRNTVTPLKYDAKTGTWVPTAPVTEDVQDSGSSPTPPTPPSDSGSETQVDSKTAAEKEYIETEFNTLTGELSLTSSEKSIRVKVNDTIKIEGLGRYLSGLYFVTAVKRTLSKDSGYTHTISVLKNGFGDSLKSPSTQEVVEPRKEEVTKTAPEIKVGDSVRIVGADATYSNAHDGVKIPEWVKKKTLTVQSISKDGTRVLLQPINSWTYISNVVKS